MLNHRCYRFAGGGRQAALRLLAAGAVLALLAGGLAACGKRGEPYRPSEVPAAETPKAAN